eukprot:2210062-Rhodomonas_salina.4
MGGRHISTFERGRHIRDLRSHVLVAALEIVGEQQAHRHARHRALDRHAGVKERQRSAADRGHARGSTALGDLWRMVMSRSDSDESEEEESGADQ